MRVRLILVLSLPLLLVALLSSFVEGRAPARAEGSAPAVAPAFPDPAGFFGYIPASSLTFVESNPYLSPLLKAPGSSHFYLVANSTVHVIDGDRRQVLHSRSSGTDWHQARLALSSDGSRLLVYPFDTERVPVTVLDGETLQILDEYSLSIQENYSVFDMTLGEEHLFVSPPYIESLAADPPVAAYIYNIKDGELVTTVVSSEAGGQYQLALGAERLYLGSSTEEGVGRKIYQYDLSGGLPVLSDTIDSGYVHEMVLSPDGQRLAACERHDGQHQLRLYSTPPLALLTSRDAPYGPVAFSPDGAYLYVLYRQDFMESPFVDVLDVETLEPVLSFKEQSSIVYGPQGLLVFDGGTLVTAYNPAAPELHFYEPIISRVTLPLVTDRYCSRPLQDDFSQDNGRWPVADRGAVAYYYDSGQYVIDVREAGRWTAVSAGDVWHLDGSKMVAVTVSGNDVHGVVLGLDDDWGNFYTFEIAPELKSWALSFFSATQGGWQTLFYAENPAINPAGPNRLRFQDGMVFINDHPVYNFAVPPGRIGLSTGSLQGAAQGRFDDYVFATGTCPLPGQAPARLRPDQLPAEGLPPAWRP